MAAGIIPPANVPGWPNLALGMIPTCSKKMTDIGNKAVFMSNAGVHTPDTTATQATLNTYAGSSDELTYNQTVKQQALFDLVVAKYNLRELADLGTTTTMTGTQVGTYLAGVGNNYRSLKAQIKAAATVAAVNAININAGWPAYP
jgi:hypothetical protein